MGRRLALVAVAAASVALLAGCSAGSAPAPTATPVPPTGDKVFRMGDLTPMTGDLAPYATAQAAGVELAARIINDNGGVNGAPMELWHRDAAVGDSTTATANLADLVAHKVDAVLAPSDEMSAEILLKPASKAKVALLAIGGPKTAAEGSRTAPASTDDAFKAQLKSADPSITEYGYGAEAYDITIAAALAASIAQDDGGPSIIAGLAQLTNKDGVTCSTYPQCLSILKDKQTPHYVGPAGAFTYDEETGVISFTKSSSAKSTKKK